jgi:hypothetical protein
MPALPAQAAQSVTVSERYKTGREVVEDQPALPEHCFEICGKNPKQLSGHCIHEITRS